MAMEDTTGRTRLSKPRRKSSSRSLTPTRKKQSKDKKETSASSRNGSSRKSASPKSRRLIDWTPDKEQQEEVSSSNNNNNNSNSNKTSENIANMRREKMTMIKMDSSQRSLTSRTSVSSSNSSSNNLNGMAMVGTRPLRRKSTGGTIVLGGLSTTATTTSTTTRKLHPRSNSVSSFSLSSSFSDLNPALSASWYDNNDHDSELDDVPETERVNKAKQRIHDMFLESRKREHAARLERAKERIRLQQEAKAVLEEETLPAARLERAYKLYRQLGAPDKKHMIQRVKELQRTVTSAEDALVSLADVEMLPWAAGGLLVNAAAFNKKMEEQHAKQRETEKNIKQIPALLKAIAKGAAAAQEEDEEDLFQVKTQDRGHDEKQSDLHDDSGKDKKKKKRSSSKKASIRKSKSSTSLDINERTTGTKKDKKEKTIILGEKGEEQALPDIFDIEGALPPEEDGKSSRGGKLRHSSSKSLSAISLMSGTSSRGSGDRRHKHSSSSKSLRGGAGHSTTKSIKSHRNSKSDRHLSSTPEGFEKKTSTKKKVQAAAKKTHKEDDPKNPQLQEPIKPKRPRGTDNNSLNTQSTDGETKSSDS